MHLPGQEGSEEWRLWWAHSQGPGIWVTMETGPRVTTNMGWNFSFRSQATEEWESWGKFFSFGRVIGGGGAWRWGEAGAGSFMFPVKIPYRTPAPRPGNQILAEIIFTLFSLFIARCIPPRIPLGSKVTPEGCQDTARSLSYASRPQHNDICPMNTVILSSLGTWVHPSTPTHNSPAAGVARVLHDRWGKGSERAKIIQNLRALCPSPGLPFFVKPSCLSPCAWEKQVIAVISISGK